LNDSVSVVNSGVWLVTPTKIYGTIVVPYEAGTATPYNITVTTFNGGAVAKESAFKIAPELLKPAVTTITPSTGTRNSTVLFTLRGTNFQPGQTTVNLTHATYGVVETTILAITPTQVVGRVNVPSDAPTGAWKLEVNTFNGGTITKSPAFTVTSVLPPAVTAFTPKYGYRGTTLSFVIKGTNFQGTGQTAVSLVLPGQDDIPSVVTSSTSTQIAGYAVIPDNAVTGAWNANVTTVNGGSKTLVKAVTVM
jgi:hypothetical protein